MIISVLLFQVVHPHHRFNRLTKRQAAYMLVFVWLLAISLSAPTLAYNHIKSSANSTRCIFFTSSSFTNLVTMRRILTVLSFIIPLAMLLFCSIRISSFLRHRQMGKADKVRKAMRVCNAIVAMFIVCFLPTTVTTIGVWVIRSYHPPDCDTLNTFIRLTNLCFCGSPSCIFSLGLFLLFF